VANDRAEAAATEEPRASPAARRAARELGVDLAAMGSGRRVREADVRAFAGSQRNTKGGQPTANGDVRATPAARKLARERGIDLASLPIGKLLREADVLAAQAESAAAAPSGEDRLPAGARPLPVEDRLPAGAGPLPVEGRLPPGTGQLQGAPRPTQDASRGLSGRRRVIADRMHASLQQMAQLTIAMEVDFSPASALREQLKKLWPDEAPTITDLVSRAAVLALATHPAVNATLDEHGLREHDHVHLGLAVDADEGLIVPVIRQADGLSLRELSRASQNAATRARANQLSLDELQGGTFTVTTLGQLGVDFFTPIVNPPQVAILGIGRVFSKLARINGEIRDVQSVYLSLSFDHRAIDGAPAARFLNEVKRLLELPAALLL
jgi:pyruvate dehydrogenase E2 component (dihydrolipoamide acetyltransferase)